MLFLLSPAKSLDYDTAAPKLPVRQPKFAADAAELIGILRQYPPSGIAGLMDLSEPLAALNTARYAAWARKATARNSKPALLAFNGDVYAGLDAMSLGAEDLAWADEHVVILSGLYGLLRPLDALQPYRLEMGTRLPNALGMDLYAWWGSRLAESLDARQKSVRAPVIVNLASQEYARAVSRRALKARLVDCVFEDWKGTQYKIISFFAKRARGAMARFAILQRLDSVEGLKAFDLDGYAYAPEVSGPDRLVFRRRLVEQH